MSDYINIMAKVSPACAERLEKVRELGGFSSKYEVVQAAVKLMLQYADPGGEENTPQSAEIAEQLRLLFGPIENVRYEMALIKPNGGKRLSPSEVIAFYGKECIMLQVVDSVGNSRTTTNRRDVLERVMRKTLPTDVLARLNELKAEGKYPTLFAVMIDVINHAARESVEVEDMFTDLSDADPARVKLGIENKPARAKNKRRFE